MFLFKDIQATIKATVTIIEYMTDTANTAIVDTANTSIVATVVLLVQPSVSMFETTHV